MNVLQKGTKPTLSKTQRQDISKDGEMIEACDMIDENGEPKKNEGGRLARCNTQPASHRTLVNPSFTHN